MEIADKNSAHARLLCVFMVEMIVIVSIVDRRSSNMVFLPTQEIRSGITLTGKPYVQFGEGSQPGG